MHMNFLSHKLSKSLDTLGQAETEGDWSRRVAKRVSESPSSHTRPYLFLLIARMPGPSPPEKLAVPPSYLYFATFFWKNHNTPRFLHNQQT
jgi:hypothetical protein